MCKISIVKGNDRKDNITRAIKLIEDDIKKSIKNKNSRQLFIKINAIDTNFPLACTHVDALDSVLMVFYDKFDEIIVGDNTFVFTKDHGGIRPQIINTKTKKLEMGEAKIKGDNIIFNITPSPGVSVCLKNAEVDAKMIVEFLGGYNFNEKEFKKDFEV